jgi:hypothetical protein
VAVDKEEDMDKFVLGTGCVAALFLAMTLGGVARKADLVNDCKTMQSFRHDDKVYDCKERNKP